LVLVFTLHVPFFRRDFHALAHGKAGARFDDAGELRRKVPGAQPEPRHDPLHRRASGMHVQQDVAEFVAKHDRRVADGIGAAGDPAVYLAQCDLVGDQDCCFNARAAGALQVHAGRAQRESRVDHALAREIPVARMLDNRTQGDVAHSLAAQIQLRDEPLQGRGHEVLVGALSVYGM
jgi:hypothetical protein